MAEHRRDDQHLTQRPTDVLKSILPEKGPSKSQVLAIVTGLPIGGFFLLLAGLTLTGTLIGLALATPVFIIFSPVLVPAVLTLAAAVFGFLTSGVFGITALSSLTWLLNQLRGFGRVPEPLEQAKKRVHDTAGQVGHKTREVGQKAQEAARS